MNPVEHLAEHPIAPTQWQGGQIAALIASGSSLTKADVEYCREQRSRVLVISDSWRLAPWADAMYSADPQWWNFHNGVPEFQGQKWTQSREAAEKWGLRWIPGDRRPGLSFDPGLIHYGNNSGYQALNLAIHFGVKRIILLGYDMQGDHWFGKHPEQLRANSNYPNFIKNFQTTVPDLERNRIRVINCSRNTALTCFPRMKLADAFREFQTS